MYSVSRSIAYPYCHLTPVIVDGAEYGSGTAGTLDLAEKEAARQALGRILPPNFTR